MVQLARRGQLLDELDVPREALREVISNALIHRSLAEGQRDSSVLVEVADEAVLVTSPGSLHVSADSATLGLAPIAGVRNLSLVRQSEQLRTPSGARAAIAATPDGVLAAKGIGEALRLRSPTSRNKWIRTTEERGLIVSTVENPFDPHGGYKLTLQGRKVLEAEQRKAQG